MYEAVLLYDTDGTFGGYAIRDANTNKLQATHIYDAGEEPQLNERIAALNTQQDLAKHWPHPQDPDVKILTDDPMFNPIEYVATQVVDEDQSTYVWKQRASEGAWEDSDELDEDASIIVYKMAMVPKRPTDAMLRIKAACEQVARKRATLSA